MSRACAEAPAEVVDGPETRLIFVGWTSSDELLPAVPRDEPVQDPRVCRALYTLHSETIKTKMMNGRACTRRLTASPLGGYSDAELERRLPYDLALARRLMAEAGWADGFEVSIDCTNDRYINDEEICIALAGMWAQLKIKVRVNAMPRSLYFPKLEKWDTSLYLLGWGGAVTDAETTLTPVMRSPGERGVPRARGHEGAGKRAAAGAATAPQRPRRRRSVHAGDGVVPASGRSGWSGSR